MKISYFQRGEIDSAKWDAAIAASSGGHPYAYSWYLDIVADGRWSALIGNDYQYVMPLPWNKKIPGIKQVYQPIFTQQLGIFGTNPTEATILQFIESIPTGFRYFILNFKEELALPNYPGFIQKKRTNLILDLNRNYEEISASYSKSLKKRIREVKKTQSFGQSYDPDPVIAFYKENLEHRVRIGKKNYSKIQSLAHACIENGIGKVFSTRLADGTLTSNGLFLFSHGRIYNIFGSSNALGRESYAMHLLLDQIIREHAGRELLFDFEGSDIPGIAKFFKSFGAEARTYTQLSYDHLPFPINLLKKWRGK